MPLNKVYEQFKKNFSSYLIQIESWEVNDENSIRVRFKNGREYIYTMTNLGFRFEQVKGD